MANRAYLYSANSDLTKLRDLSESRFPFPFFYKVVLGEDTSICESQTWEFDKPIAIKGDFTKGLQKLLAFYDYLQTQSGIDTLAIAKFKKETTDFFEKEKERINQYFFLEGYEIFTMICNADEIPQENAYLYEDIVGISAQINEILATKPADVFAFSEATWLHEIKKDIEFLSVYWTHVTYISFNRS